MRVEWNKVLHEVIRDYFPKHYFNNYRWNCAEWGCRFWWWCIFLALCSSHVSHLLCPDSYIALNTLYLIVHCHIWQSWTYSFIYAARFYNTNCVCEVVRKTQSHSWSFCRRFKYYQHLLPLRECRLFHDTRRMSFKN